jgi:hypothetical protein
VFLFFSSLVKNHKIDPSKMFFHNLHLHINSSFVSKERKKISLTGSQLTKESIIPPWNFLSNIYKFQQWKFVTKKPCTQNKVFTIIVKKFQWPKEAAGSRKIPLGNAAGQWAGHPLPDKAHTRLGCLAIGGKY